VQTAGSTLTAQQPHNNVVRVTLQAMAAVLGGAQSLHTNAMDEALALPTEEAARLALRTQQILAEETGVRDAVDPLGGAAAIEEATDRLEAEAATLIAEIDARGGAVQAIDFERRETEKSALAWQRDVEAGRRIVVGINRHVEPAAPAPLRLLKVDERVQAGRRESLARVRARRDGAAADRALGALRAARDRDENLFPAVLDAVKADATLGEICGALEERYGRHREGERAR
jgi:methylmalonyl-CoA mutase N-terminal domain/subunit